MGRPKKELKRIHNRKVKKAKQKLQQYTAGTLTYPALSERAKHFLRKGKKKKALLS